MCEIISIVFIIFMGAKKDTITNYRTMPAEQVVSFVETTTIITLVKSGKIALVTFLIK